MNEPVPLDGDETVAVEEVNDLLSSSEKEVLRQELTHFDSNSRVSIFPLASIYEVINVNVPKNSV